MPSARFLPFCIVAALYVYGQPAGKPKQPEVVPQPGAIGSRMPEFAVKDFNGRQISSS